MQTTPIGSLGRETIIEMCLAHFRMRTPHRRSRAFRGRITKSRLRLSQPSGEGCKPVTMPMKPGPWQGIGNSAISTTECDEMGGACAPGSQSSAQRWARQPERRRRPCHGGLPTRRGLCWCHPTPQSGNVGHHHYHHHTHVDMHIRTHTNARGTCNKAPPKYAMLKSAKKGKNTEKMQISQNSFRSSPGLHTFQLERT